MSLPAHRANGRAWALIETAWGFVAVVGDDEALDYVGYPLPTPEAAAMSAQRAQVDLGELDLPSVHWAEAQIVDYFLGRPVDLAKLPVRLTGSVFQLRVWDVSRSIELGKTLSYGEVAGLAGYHGAARAAGSALSANPAGLLIPCHRIVAANGLGGYGNNPEHKIALLELEHVRPPN